MMIKSYSKTLSWSLPTKNITLYFSIFHLSDSNEHISDVHQVVHNFFSCIASFFSGDTISQHILDMPAPFFGVRGN